MRKIYSKIGQGKREGGVKFRLDLPFLNKPRHEYCLFLKNIKFKKLKFLIQADSTIGFALLRAKEIKEFLSKAYKLTKFS